MLLAYQDRQQAGSYIIYTRGTPSWCEHYRCNTPHPALSICAASAAEKIKRPFIYKNNPLKTII
jgi:hypothetical protein